MSNRNDWLWGSKAFGADNVQDALGLFMARSIGVIEGLRRNGGDGLSAFLEDLTTAEGALRDLGASDYFISRVTWIVVETMSEGDHSFYGRSLDIRTFADFLRGGSEWDA
jgi:hypothetical protein